MSESWFHCVALGKWLLHSVPGFPCVYKTNPNDFMCQALLLVACPSASLEKAGAGVITIFLTTINRGLMRGRDLPHNRLVRVMHQALLWALSAKELECGVWCQTQPTPASP